MTPRSGDDTQRGLTRDRLVQAGLELVHEQGLEALSMRGLADRLEVRASSLYWHVRDRRELLELLADAILEDVAPAHGGGDWRQAALTAEADLRETVTRQKDADRILLEVPDALERSEIHGRLAAQFRLAGLEPAEAKEVASMVLTYAVTQPQARADRDLPDEDAVASIAVDSGSKGVLLRAGSEMETLIAATHDRTTAGPAIVRGETVVVRRLRGVGASELELNPKRPWRFRIQGPTWNTVLDLGGLEVREIKLDSGAAKVECFLPEPRGVVPIVVSGGVVGVSLHRPPGAAVIADISSGAVRIRLDEFSIKAAVTDLHWESEGASKAQDRYEVRISGGAVHVNLDSRPGTVPARRAAPESVAPTSVAPVSGLEILLDGVEARMLSRRPNR